MTLNLKLLKLAGSSYKIVNKSPFLSIISPNLNHAFKLSTTAAPIKSEEEDVRNVNISKAMQSYLERAKAHDAFLKIKNDEFELGKRHLANIMNVNVEDLNQEEIDKAIQYLMPSGLFDPRSRPMMKPPLELYPKRKDAEFDVSGRPFHSFFYCKKPNLYEILFQAVEKLHELNAHEDQMVLKGQLEPPKKLDLDASQWQKQVQLSNMILETITDDEYAKLIETLDKLTQHPFAYLAEEFIMKYRAVKKEGMKAIEIAPLNYDAEGRPFVVAEGSRKTSKCTLTLKGQGSGKVSINGRDILQFATIASRHQVMFPLQFTNLLGKMDIEATGSASSEESLAGAVRFALSKALCSFVDDDTREDMRLAGLLTYDRRKHERQKPGQKGARAKYKWLKR